MKNIKRFFIQFGLLLACFLSFQLCAKNTVQSVRVWSAPENTKVVFDLNNKPQYRYFSLHKPERLVIDFDNTFSKVDLKKLSYKSPLVNKIRISKPAKKSSYRVVLELNGALKPQVFTLKPTKPYGHRLVIELPTTQKKKAVKKKSQHRDPDIIIAIDAGHGGEDPGSVGLKGTHEKKIALQISRRLEKLVNATDGMKAKMIRTGDYYVKLHRRSEKARNYKADLLVSIHADAVFNRKPKGASVWVLSTRRANSEIGRWIEKGEQHSDLLGGAAEIIHDTDSERYLARTLLDMSMDSSRNVSHQVASEIAIQLGRVTTMHKKVPAAASLAVLKAPDIPSVLVETGFISNPQEEKLLRQGRHQQKIAKALHKALVSYYAEHPITGTYLALKSEVKHQVRSGESLSLIAQKYGVSWVRLKKANRLKKDILHVGQVLIIPRT